MAKKNNVDVFINADFNENYIAKFMINENKKTVSCTITENLPLDIETISDVSSILDGFDKSKLEISATVPADITVRKAYSKDVEYTGMAICDSRDKFDAGVGCGIAFKQAVRKRHNAAMQSIQDYISLLDNVKSKLLEYKNYRKRDFQMLMQADMDVVTTDE